MDDKFNENDDIVNEVNENSNGGPSFRDRIESANNFRKDLSDERAKNKAQDFNNNGPKVNNNLSNKNDLNNNINGHSPGLNNHNNNPFANSSNNGIAKPSKSGSQDKTKEALEKARKPKAPSNFNKNDESTNTSLGDASSNKDDKNSLRDKNNGLEDKKDSNNSTSKPSGLSKALGAASTAKAVADGGAGAAADIVKAEIKKKIRTKVIAWLAASGGAFLGWTLIIVIGLMLFLMPVIYLNEYWQGIKTKVAEVTDRFVNFTTFKGWNTSSEVFRNKLYAASDSEFNKWNDLNYKEGQYDVPLVVSTIYSLKSSDLANASDEVSYENEKTDYTDTDEIFGANNTNQEKAFYKWATEWLGSFGWDARLTFDLPSLVASMLPAEYDITSSIQGGLSGHLVNYKIRYSCVSLFDPNDEDPDADESLWNYLRNTLSDVATNTNIDLDFIITSLISYIDNEKAFGDLGVDYNDAKKLSSYFDKYSQDTNRLWSYVSNKNSDTKEQLELAKGSCTGFGDFVVPKFTAYIDYELYEKYVEEVFIPATYFLCDKCDYRDRYVKYINGGKSDEKEKSYFQDVAINIYRSIVESKDTYNELFDTLNLTGISSQARYKSCSGYTTKDETVADIKVKLLRCKSGLSYKNYQESDVLETVDFDKYVSGVVYAEMGYSDSMSEGALQAQAIAVRSYAIKNGLKESTNEVIIQNCEYKQVYCDYINGCTRNPNGIKGAADYYSGTTGLGKIWKNGLTGSSLLRFEQIMGKVAGVVALDANGGVISTGYNSDVTNSFTSMGNSGLDYNSIIMQTYSNAVTLSDSCSAVGDFVNWKQYDATWGGQWVNPNASEKKTIKQVGCALTSTSMLIAKSGTKVTINPFDPGTFAAYMAEHGGFSGNNIYWGAVSTSGLAPNFVFTNTITLSGSKSQKIDTMRKYYNEGYYMVVCVKHCGHWVALDTVVGDTVYMMDPASTSTDLFKYSSDGIDQMKLFKKTD